MKRIALMIACSFVFSSLSYASFQDFLKADRADFAAAAKNTLSTTATAKDKCYAARLGEMNEKAAAYKIDTDVLTALITYCNSKRTATDLTALKSTKGVTFIEDSYGRRGVKLTKVEKTLNNPDCAKLASTDSPRDTWFFGVNETNKEKDQCNFLKM